MQTQPVHWHEGQFLRPHHFQQATRHAADLVATAARWTQPHAYGFQALQIDEGGLANWRFTLRRAHCMLYDGTLLRVPEDVSLQTLEIPRNLFESDSRVTVHLGLAPLDLGRANAGDALERQRFVVESLEAEDENLPANAQRVDLRRLNPQILVGDEAARGFDTLPVARLRPAATAVAVPELDPDFLPPALTLGAWDGLQQGRLRPIRDRLSEVASRLASQMNDRGVAFETEHREDAERIFKLQAINAVLGSIEPLVTVPGLHPIDAYRELCRAVGLLAIFKSARKTPELPAYDHDRLGDVFIELARLLDVGVEEKKGYEKRDFRGEGLQMQVRLDGEWLGPDWNFYVGVHSRMSLADVDRLLRGRLELKAGATDEVEMIYQRATAGVHLKVAPNPPRDFPSTDWSYWRLDRESPAWRRVEESLHFGIRFNERQAEGAIDGAEEVVVRNPDTGDLESLSFSLFAMPAGG